ncbi:nuclease-associated modular DNA-binding 1 [Vibrio phage 1.213.O._10N.222.54.F10]|nr:nuclease-associated modular DNA-binding 1 [Vibrio phage 1.213.O._10N.222.54.F10]
MARPRKLAKYSQEEVRQKVLELGTIKEAAKFYGCVDKVVSNKIGNFHHRGVDPKDEAEILSLLKFHNRKTAADLMGYSVHQITWLTKRKGVKCPSIGKPNAVSPLSYYEMNNMDEVVKDYETIGKCAEALGVSDKTIYKHLKACRNREAVHSNNQAV